MPRLILFLAMLAQTSTLFAESLVIEPKHASFEPAIASSTVNQSYTITNHGKASVAIRDWKAISGFGEVLNLPAKLAPGESRQFQVSLALPGKLGESGFRYALFTDEADVERYRFTLSGFVFSVISPEKAVIDLGAIDAQSKARKELTLDAREGKPLQLARIIDAPDWIDASVGNATISVGIRSNASRGIKAGTIRVATNLAQQPVVEVTVKATVEGGLKPSAYALGFKPTEVGQEIKSHLEIGYSGGLDIDDLKIESPGDWKIVRGSCTDTTASPETCVRIELSQIIKESGRSSGVLKFSMPGEPDLEIPFGIMGLKPDQTIREVLVNDDQQVDAPKKIDITKAIQEQRETTPIKPVPQDQPAVKNVSRAKGSGPVQLRWKAANDGSIHGFMVYRSEDRAGPFVRVTPRPLPKHESSSPAASGGDYEFVDDGVEPGKTYYYYIDTVAKSGIQQRLSPVLSKTVTP